MKQTLKEQNWEKQFKQEFGIHFSKSELQFALSFIDDILKEEKKKLIKKVSKFDWLHQSVDDFVKKLKE
jgi:hypothetical protein